MVQKQEIKLLKADDILAALNSAINAATLGQDTKRSCSYIEYEFKGARYTWNDLPEEAFREFRGESTWKDYSKASREWREEHAAAPHCIVGVVLSEAGVPLSFLADWEDIRVGGIANAALGKVGLALDERAREVLETAQLIQDDDCSWGAAVEGAQNYYDSFTDGAHPLTHTDN